MPRTLEALLLGNRCTILGSPASAHDLRCDNEEETESNNRSLDAEGYSGSGLCNPLKTYQYNRGVNHDKYPYLSLEIGDAETTSCSPKVDPRT